MKSLGACRADFLLQRLWRDVERIYRGAGGICKNGSLGPFPLALRGPFLASVTCEAGAAAAL